MRCHPDTASVSHGGYSQTRATIGMGGISATLIGQTSGDTMIRNCSMLSLGSCPPAKETFGHWKRPVFFPEQSIPGEILPIGGPRSERSRERHRWFARVRSSLAEPISCSLTPTMGLSLRATSQFRQSRQKRSARASYMNWQDHERCLVVYHHQSRRKGGHQCEIVYCAERLRASGFATVDALRAKPYLPACIFCSMRRLMLGDGQSRSSKLAGMDHLASRKTPMCSAVKMKGRSVV